MERNSEKNKSCFSLGVWKSISWTSFRIATHRKAFSVFSSTMHRRSFKEIKFCWTSSRIRPGVPTIIEGLLVLISSMFVLISTDPCNTKHWIWGRCFPSFLKRIASSSAMDLLWHKIKALGTVEDGMCANFSRRPTTRLSFRSFGDSAAQMMSLPDKMLGMSIFCTSEGSWLRLHSFNAWRISGSKPNWCQLFSGAKLKSVNQRVPDIGKGQVAEFGFSQTKEAIQFLNIIGGPRNFL